MTMSGRIPCCVPFCRRSAARKDRLADATEIICGKHWRAAPAHLRRRLSKIRRLRKRAIMRGDLMKNDQAVELDWKLWNQIKAAVIEAAAGMR